MSNIVLEQTERTRIHRLPERGAYDRHTIQAILDEALICHVGFAVEGRPVVIPTIHARIDDRDRVHAACAPGALANIRAADSSLSQLLADL